MMASKLPNMSLSSAIASLHEEIGVAAKNATRLNYEERFRVVEAEIELTLALEQSADGGAELNWGVVKFGLDGTLSKTATHKLRLKLDLGEMFVGRAGGDTE